MNATARKPNIVLIVSDQQRADCLGCYGNREVRTPALDALAADGTAYDASYCSAPVCTPSRISLLTGLYAHQHLGWSNVSTIPPATETFASALRRAGYRTAAVGKMHLTPTYQRIGFDEMLLAEQNGEGRYEDDYHRYLLEHGLIDRVDLVDQVRQYRERAGRTYWDSFGTGASDLPEEHHSTAWIGRQALEQLEHWDGGGQPRLLMVSFVKPHHPFDPPRPWDRMYDPARLTLLPGWTEECLPGDLELHEGFFPHRELTEEKLKTAMAHYYGAISHVDHYIGQMLQLLKDKRLYDDTLIIYTSDHGEYMGYHHLLLKQNYMYEPLAKVPLVIKWPGAAGEGGGKRSDRLVSNVDLAVTMLAQAGATPPPAMAGADLADPAAAREFVFGEEAGGRQYMVRSREYKLIWRREERQCRFFDLAADPHELVDQFGNAAYAREIERHRQALLSLLLFEHPAPNYLDESAPALEKGKRHRADREAVKARIHAEMLERERRERREGR